MQPKAADNDYINGLPAELLLDIFRHNLDERALNLPKSYYHSVLQLILVCRRWKDVLERDQYTWGFIPRGVTGHVVQNLLSRSGVAPLRIADRFISSRSSPSSSSGFTDVLIPQAHRWQDLSLLVTKDNYHQLHEILEKHDLPLLTSLRLFVHRYLDFRTFAPAFLGRNRPPRLRKLELRDLSVGFSPAWAGLEHLVIDRPWWCPSLDAVVSVLRASPSLQRLELQFDSQGEQALSSNERIPMPHLEHIRLHWGTYNGLILPLLAMEPDKLQYINTMSLASIDPDPSSTNGFFACVRHLCRSAELIYIQLDNNHLNRYWWRITDTDPNKGNATTSNSSFRITSLTADNQEAGLPVIIDLLNSVAPADSRFVLHGLDRGPRIVPGYAARTEWLRPFKRLRGEIFAVEATLRSGYGGVMDAIAGSGWHWHIGPFKQLIATVDAYTWQSILDAIRYFFKLDVHNRKQRARDIRALGLKALVIIISKTGTLGPDWARTKEDLVDLLGVDSVHLVDPHGNVFTESR